jgi:hypothetical protein
MYMPGSSVLPALHVGTAQDSSRLLAAMLWQRLPALLQGHQKLVSQTTPDCILAAAIELHSYRMDYNAKH